MWKIRGGIDTLHAFWFAVAFRAIVNVRRVVRKVRRVLGLLVTLAAVLLLTGCAQENAKAEIMLLQAARDDQARGIQLQYDQAKASIQADAVARLDLEKKQAAQAIEVQKAIAQVEYEKQTQLDLLEATHKKALADIDATYQRQIADVQAYTDKARAAAARDVIIALSIGIGGGLCAILVGRGIGNGVTAWARNRGEVVRPDAAGIFPAIVRSDAVLLPSRMSGAYMVIRRPSAGERLIVAAGTAVALMRGKPVDRYESPWVQVGEGDPNVTARDQAQGLLAAATRTPSAIGDRVTRSMLGSSDAPTAATPPPAITPPTYVAPSPVAIVPSFAETLRNWHPTRERMLFGYTQDGTPLHGRLDQLLSGEIVGRQGSGKTTLLRMIYAQCLIVGVRVIVWDLHEDIVSDLPGAVTYTDAQAIDRSAAWLVAELDRRIAQHDKTGTPIMILIDEINQLANVVPAVIEAIGRVVNEGRKYHVYCVVSAKGMPAAMFNGSTVRDSFATRFAFQTTTRQAAMIGFDRDAVPLVRDLTPGRALFEGPWAAQVITIPWTSTDDVKGILRTSNAEAETRKSLSLSPSDPANAEMEAETTTPENAAEKVADMRAAGTGTAAIIAQLWGVTGGRRYAAARAQLAEIERVTP